MDITLDESIVLNHSAYKIRNAVRVIVFDDNKKIALCGSDYFLLPGGGVENDESLYDTSIRECLEEIGCHITNIEELGKSREIKSKNNLIQIAHYLIAVVSGEKGQPTTNQSNELNRVVKWLALDEAISLIESYMISISDLSYNARFNIHANLHFLKKCKQEIKT